VVAAAAAAVASTVAQAPSFEDTLFSDGCTPRMAGVCNRARYAVDQPSRIDVDRGLNRQLTV
jgi:hypothetical protein